MSRFLSRLNLELLVDEGGRPLKSRSGRKLFRVAERFAYQSDLIGLVEVPAGFITDLGSVPRLPLVYLLFGDHLHHEAVIHDYLYSSHSHVDRRTADAVLLEVCDITGLSWFISRGSWIGVRLGGWMNFEGGVK